MAAFVHNLSGLYQVSDHFPDEERVSFRLDSFPAASKSLGFCSRRSGSWFDQVPRAKLLHWRSRPEGYALGPKFGGTWLLGRAGKHIGLPSDLKVQKSGVRHQLLKLCIQQSAGNSAGPVIDLLFR